MAAPIFMVCMGYWMLGNRQMFYNEIIPIQYGNNALLTEHGIFDFSKGFDYTLVLLIFVFMFRFYRSIGKFGLKIIKKFYKFKTFSKINDDWDFCDEVDENIGFYFESLHGMTQKTFFANQVNM
jgi:hypothetical protein